MRVFKDVGLVEQLGSGMSRILHSYDRNIFEISDHFIKVVFRFPEIKPLINVITGDENGNENRILMLLEKEPGMTAKRLSTLSGFSTRKISRIIKNLKMSGKITRIGSDKKGYWKINQNSLL